MGIGCLVMLSAHGAPGKRAKGWRQSCAGKQLLPRVLGLEDFTWDISASGTWWDFWNCPVQGQDLSSTILVGPLQLRIFCDSIPCFLCYFCSSWYPGNAGVGRSSGPLQRAWRGIRRYFCVSCSHWKLQADFLMGRADSVRASDPCRGVFVRVILTPLPPRQTLALAKALLSIPVALGMGGSPPRWVMRKEGGVWQCSGGCVISHFPFEACRSEEPSEPQSPQCS